MSVNRDPRVGDRFLWDGGTTQVKTITAIDGNRFYYEYEDDPRSGQLALTSTWRRDATLYEPDPPTNVPAVGTEFKWNVPYWNSPQLIRTVDAVVGDLVVWHDQHGRAGTVPLELWDRRARFPESPTPPEWPADVNRVGIYPPNAAVLGTKHFCYENADSVYDVEPLRSGKVLLHPLREDGTRW